MQNNLMFVPGQQLKEYDVYRKSTQMNDKRRVLLGDLAFASSFKATIASASQREVERFREVGHPITHTLVAQMRADVRPEDIIVLHGDNAETGARYTVQGVDDPAGLGFYTIVHCLYREGA